MFGPVQDLLDCLRGLGHLLRENEADGADRNHADLRKYKRTKGHLTNGVGPSERSDKEEPDSRIEPVRNVFRHRSLPVLRFCKTLTAGGSLKARASLDNWPRQDDRSSKYR